MSYNTGNIVYLHNFMQVHFFKLQGHNPLYIAAFKGYSQVVELLVEKVADIDSRYANVSTNYI